MDTTTRWTGIVLVVAVMALFAGCTATSGGNGNTTVEKPANGTDLSNGSAGEANLTVTNASVESLVTEDAENASLEAQHAAALNRSENATVVVGANLDTEYGDLAFDSATQLDLETEQARQHSTTNFTTGGGLIQATVADVHSFATPNATYEQIDSDFANETEYDHRDLDTRHDIWNETTISQYLETDLIGNADENVDWERDGTEQFDGTETVRFVAAGNSTFHGFHENATEAIDDSQTDTSAGNGTDGGNGAGSDRSFTIEDDMTVREVNATLLVDRNGIARHLTYELNATADGRELYFSIELSLVDLDETSVERPDWLDQARSASDESGGNRTADDS